jgi:hypothetical protein
VASLDDDDEVDEDSVKITSPLPLPASRLSSSLCSLPARNDGDSITEEVTVITRLAAGVADTAVTFSVGKASAIGSMLAGGRCMAPWIMSSNLYKHVNSHFPHVLAL